VFFFGIYTKKKWAVLRKEDIPMGEFLVNVLAMVVAGVIVALIMRFFDV